MEEELLSNEEMAALLPETPADETARERERKKRIVPYNFRRPDRLSKEQVRSLYLLHDLFAHSLSSSLPLFLRAVSEVNLISVEQQSYSDYMRGLSDPTTIFTIAASPLRGVFVVELNTSIALSIVDRMLGGEGQEVKEMRAATDLELNILEGFLKVVTDTYCEAWKPMIEFETEIVGRETHPQLVQIVAPNEVVATIVYQLQIGEVQGVMSICLPVVLLETVIEKFSQSAQSSNDKTSPEATRLLLKKISNVRFGVSAELEKVPAAVSDLMSLAVGDVLRTNHSIEKPVNIAVGSIVKFHGRLAALDQKMVAQIIAEAADNFARN
ncbi:MAG: flagellar motor switch protein FliM [Acidobacteria bacterium]|nr:flagellar motor switch protein FliM [Acidobacteriota bacterium]